MDDANLAEAQRRTSGRAASPEITAYIDASANALRRRSSMRRAYATAVTGLLVISLMSLGVIIVQRRSAIDQAEVANSERLAAEALHVQADQPDLSALLAAHSWLTRQTDQARTAAINVLQQPIFPGRSLSSDRGPVSHLSVSADGRLQAFSTGRGQVLLRDHSTPDRPVRQLAGEVSAGSPVAVSPDGSLVIAVDRDSSMVIWDLADGTQQRKVRLPISGFAVAAAFRPGSLEVVVIGGDSRVIRLDLASPDPSPNLMLTLDRPVTAHGGLAFSPDGRMLAIVEGRQIRMWNLVASLPLTQRPSIPSGQLNGIAFSPDGTLIAAGAADRAVRLWKIGAGPDPIASRAGHDNVVSDVAFSPGGTQLASAGTDHSIRLWSIDSAARLTPIARLTAHAGPVNALSFAGDSELVSASEDGTIRIWQTQQENGALPTTASVRAVSFSPEDRLLAAGDEDGWLSIWNVADRQLQVRIPTRRSADPAITQVEFMPDGKTVATAGADGTLSVWDIQREEMVMSVDVGDAYVAGMDLSPDGSMFVTGNGAGLVQLWDSRTGREIGGSITAHQGRVDNVAFSPDQSLIASTGNDDSVVRLWRTTTHQQAGHDMLLENGAAAWGVVFSPDARILATTGADFSLRLWGVADQRLIREPERGHQGATDGLAFSPDGTLIATASADRTIRLWHPDEPGQIGGPLLGHDSWVDALTFSHDGRMLASSSVEAAEKSIRLWDLDPTEWATKLCLRAGRNLSLSEWERYQDGPYRRTCPDLPSGPDAPTEAPAIHP